MRLMHGGDSVLANGASRSHRPRGPAPWIAGGLVVAGLVLVCLPVLTNLYAVYHQARLRAQLSQAASPHDGNVVSDPADGDLDGSAGAAVDREPRKGEALFLLEIPKIGVTVAVVEGVDPGSLRKGPGRYPGSAWPGRSGNLAIAGHRDIYGSWFRRLDQLVPGDVIVAVDPPHRFRYVVERSYTVGPDDREPLRPTTQPVLTLTTCTPFGVNTQRLIVRARLVPDSFRPWIRAGPRGPQGAAG